MTSKNNNILFYVDSFQYATLKFEANIVNSRLDISCHDYEDAFRGHIINMQKNGMCTCNITKIVFYKDPNFNEYYSTHSVRAYPIPQG